VLAKRFFERMGISPNFISEKLSDRFLRMLADDWDWLGWSDIETEESSGHPT
jgi:hypothetical protein